MGYSHSIPAYHVPALSLSDCRSYSLDFHRVRYSLHGRLDCQGKGGLWIDLTTNSGPVNYHYRQDMEELLGFRLSAPENSKCVGFFAEAHSREECLIMSVARGYI